MPAGDRTGPNGMGPKSGRGAGYCSGYDRPGYTNPVRGRIGFGLGRGGGRMRGRGFWRRRGFDQYFDDYPPNETPTHTEGKNETLAYLKDLADNINKRIDDLERRIETKRGSESDN